MISVLIADSQRLFAQALREALAQQPDLEPLRESPPTGLETVNAALKLAPDVTLLDYWMTGMEGPAVTRLILKRAPERRIILLCWFHGTPEIQEGISAGAAGVLSKDVEVPNLAEAIRQVHAGYPLLGGADVVPTQPGSAPRGTQNWEGVLNLTPREIEILGKLAVSGRPEDVAKELFVSLGTIRNHIQHIMIKMGARSHVEAVVMAQQHGLI